MEAEELKEMVIAALHEVYDPEIPVDIYELGLIYEVEILPINNVQIVMTLTAPSCPSAQELPLEVEENITATLEQQLKNGVIDAAVIALPFNVPGIETTPLYDEDFNVVVPVNHPWATRKSIHAEELSTEKVLLLNTGHCFSNQVTQACPELSRKGEVLQGNSLETIRNMVASNLGITVLPAMATAARYQNPLIRVIPFSKPAPSRRIALAWRKSFVRTAAIEVLGKVMAEVGEGQAQISRL